MLCPLLEKPRASLLCPCGRNRGQWGRGLFAANRRSGRKQQKRRRRQYQFWSADSRQSQIVPHLLFRVIEKKKICVKYANNQPSKRRKSSCHHVLCKAILEGELCVDVPKCHPLLQMGIKNQKLLKLHALQSRIFLLTQQLTREVCELIVYTACLSWLLKNNNCPQKNVACQLPIKSRRYRVIFVLLLRKKITIFEFYKKKKCTVDIRTMYYSIHSVSGTTVYLINSRTCLCVQCGNTMYMYVHIFVKWVYYRARFHNYQKCFGLQVKIKWLMKKLFLPSDNWKAFWNYQHHYYKIEYKRQYLIKFMTKKKILKPNWKSCLIFA